MALHYLTIEDFQIICSALDELFKHTKEPPPDYRQTYFEKLDSIIAIPQKTFADLDLYPTLYDKAACYFYFINKFHPFNNGNKRLSIVATGVFLRYNKYDLVVDDELLYKFAKEVTNHEDDHAKEFKKVVDFIYKHSSTTLTNRFQALIERLQLFSLRSRTPEEPKPTL